MNMLRIAVDGPAGSGKSTVAKVIAKDLGITYLDTGAMYRAVTLYFLDQKIDFSNDAKVQSALGQLEIDMSGSSITLNKIDVTEAIRTPEVNENVSRTAALSTVRKAMVQQQRHIAGKSSIIMDGRDIGTVVLPDAELKFFLTASVEERAHRRFLELSAKGYELTLEDVIIEISSRDQQDSEREDSPLVQADDAILIDTTGKSIELVIQEIKNHIANKNY